MDMFNGVLLILFKQLKVVIENIITLEAFINGLF